MSLEKKGKTIAIIAVSLVVIAGIAIGAYRGRTIEQTPSEVTATVGGGQAAAGNDEGLTVLKTWTRKDCSLAPWLVTDKLGYFKEEGIKLVFTGELQPNQQIPSIINGNNDVASVHPNQLAVAVAGGAKLKGVSRGIIEPDESVDPKFRHMWFFVNPTKHPEIKSIADLKNFPGKIKFSIITTNTCTDFLTNTLFDKYGIPKDKIEWVTMPDIQAIQALKQGLVDVSPVHPPFYKGMEDAGAIRIADSFETGLGSLAGLTAYYFTEDFINQNPDTVKRFVRAISKGQKYADEHPDQVAQWVSDAIGIPVTGNHWYADDTTIDENDLIPWIKQLEDNKVIPVGKVKASDLVVHVFEQYGNETKK
ncbi:ABC-type nitrate/sulfonate/bicarbonate transport systems periplasmic components-like protein [Syntrophobotulus glycolicus DSM 8271]|uniref:ABC-type nitrate/sulfonate/bicarbonate transport systems periplasmic components-like protein n=1 Tax=Syntrophobotulus glycolicus (strain DSM 8271 / FlGlyR) TaxID=645991 RepID=F0SXX4_SYNGF|nr:ABC transporter substrate-binding protein [Syntrophobotulus glycolicus]ADY57035.1 ABC-type nitrate/sulfonate/bicarbonate transport systems periplasmic components-like protein [Syntrophobotulus glycolicus DSM 8271]